MKTPGGGGFGQSNDEDNTKYNKVEVNLQSAFTERGSVFEYRQAQESV